MIQSAVTGTMARQCFSAETICLKSIGMRSARCKNA